MGTDEILYLAREMPFPLDTGVRIRNYHILRAYAGVGKVRFLFFYEHEDELAALSTLESLVAEFHPVKFCWTGRPRRPGTECWRRNLAEGDALRPFLAGLRFSHDMREAVERVAPACSLIHTEQLALLPHAEAFLGPAAAGPRVVLDLDDVETRFLRRSLRVAPPAGLRGRLAAYVDLMLLERYQRRALQRCDAVFTCSEYDRRLLGTRPSIAVIPNGADVSSQPLPDDTDGRTVLCLGTYGHWPNVDGLTHFLTRILPLIHEDIPGLRLLIVGKDMPSEVAKLHDGTGILVAANVPSVEAYYRSATVSVVPLRAAGGTRVKILEAFALGRAVVSTSIGCEGLEVVHDEHLLVADEPQAFARACVTLLRNSDLRARLVARARALVEQRYAWEKVRERVAEVATGLLGEVRATRRTTAASTRRQP